MLQYAVTADTGIDEYAHESLINHDGTTIYRFSKKLLAYIETCVASVRTTGRMTPRITGPTETYYTAAVHAYAAISYKNSTTTW
jgi:hypothetical protein